MKRKLNQQGIVAIVSIMLIIIIISVITLSLATLSRRGLRQALDEQLSTQALYAAESGINDAINLGINTNINDCSAVAAGGTFPSANLGGNVRYTCVLIDQTPTSIQSDVTTTGIKNFRIESSDPLHPVNNLNISWKSTDSNFVPDFTPCEANGCFTPAASWGNRLGLLRIRLVPSSTMTRDYMKNTVDIVGYPGKSSAGVESGTLDVATSKALLYGKCSSGSCSISLSNLSSVSSKFYLQLYSYYKDINVTVTGTDTSVVPTPIKFLGAQKTIDSTGAAGDVLKRIKVNVPVSNTTSYDDLPVASLGVGDELCKRFTTNATATVDDDPVNCTAF